MGLQLQSGPATRTVEPERVALVLSGFRNDLSRHRALAFLEKRFAVKGAEIRLPFTIAKDIDVENANQLADELNRLGAIVGLVRPEPPAAEELPPEPLMDLPFPATVVVPEPAFTVRSLPRRMFGQFGSAIRIPIMVFTGMLMFSTFRAWMINQGEDAAHQELATSEAKNRARRVELRQREELQRQQRRKTAGIPEPGTTTSYVSASQVQSLLRQGDTVAALKMIQGALSEGETSLLMGLKGDVYAAMSNWDTASKAYERAIQLGSTDGKVYLALAGIYRQQGKQSAAVDMLHKAQEHGAKGHDFDALVGTVKTEQDAESAFGSEASPHFTISFDRGEDHAEAQRILGLLEDAYLTVGRKLDAYPNHRIPAVIYAAEDFQEVTHAPGWAGALYDGRIKIPVRGSSHHAPDLAGTIRHEYTHALINTIAGTRCPVWLHEGVAMWAEDKRPGERKSWALSAIQLEDTTTLTRLEGTFVGLSGRRAVAAYARSYLAVQHIVDRYGELPLRKLLEAFTTTKTTAEAFREALDVDLAIFEEELHSDQGEVG